MMQRSEWPRSRYWHIYFLQSRHQREPIAWDTLPTRATTGSTEDALSPAVCQWLTLCAHRQRIPKPWLLHDIENRCANDPAYIQSFRLLLREQQYHAQLIEKILQELMHQDAVSIQPQRDLFLELGRLLGPRYALASMLLADVIDITILQRLYVVTEQTAVKQACQAIIQEKRGHIAFHRERLTMEFTEFNFIRRNLRRYRLRTILMTKLSRTGFEHQDVLGDLGLSFAQLTRTCHRQFEQVLEQMVPYHRETLMGMLVTQRENPYDDAQLMDD